jgi:tetratricopeptide (TPR) repeat protein
VGLLTSCSSISQYERTQEVVHTLQEVDRQFTIEDTSTASFPDDKGAKIWIHHALALMPHSAMPYIGDADQPGLVAILEMRGRYPLLIDLLKRAVADPKIRLDQQYYSLLLALADAEERVGPTSGASKTYADALVQINKSVGKAGDTFDPNSSLLLDRARAEYYGGRKPQALKDFQSIITTDPENAPAAKNDMAYFLALDKTNLSQAKTLATEAVAEARKQGDDDVIGMYEDTLAWVDHQQGNDKDALYYEQEAASLIPLMADVQYHLGAICVADGQDLQAKVAFTRAIKLDPYFSEARSALQALPSSPVDVQSKLES